MRMRSTLGALACGAVVLLAARPGRAQTAPTVAPGAQPTNPLAATTGPPAGTGPGGYTGGGLGSSSFYLATVNATAVTNAGTAAAVTPTTSILATGTTGTPPAASASSPAPVTGTAPAATSSAAVNAANPPAALPTFPVSSPTAIPGVSAVGETLSAGGTAVTPAAISVPSSTAASTATPQSYPSLLD
jgi:hypothetical protein